VPPGAKVCGFSDKAATEFSFQLGIPTLHGARAGQVGGRTLTQRNWRAAAMGDAVCMKHTRRQTSRIPRIGAALAALAMSGCASLSVIDAVGLQVEYEEGKWGYAQQLEAAQRLHRVAWQLKQRGVKWCGPLVRHETGLAFWTDEASERSGRRLALAPSPSDDRPKVLFVAPGSAAEKAGVRVGDVVGQVNGEPARPGLAGHEQLAAWAKKVAASAAVQTLEVQRAGVPVTVALTPELVCDFEVALRDASWSFIGMGQGRRIHVVPRFVEERDDKTLAFALAHVAAHGVLGHDENKRSTSNVATAVDVPFFIAGFALAIASMGAYPQAAAMPFTTLNEVRLRLLEPDADLWGLGMAMSAGFVDVAGDLRQLPMLADLTGDDLAGEQERDERVLRVAQAVQALDAWRAEGRPLVPDPELIKAMRGLSGGG
jgi:PDZ domain